MTKLFTLKLSALCIIVLLCVWTPRVALGDEASRPRLRGLQGNGYGGPGYGGPAYGGPGGVAIGGNGIGGNGYGGHAPWWFGGGGGNGYGGPGYGGPAYGGVGGVAVGGTGVGGNGYGGHRMLEGTGEASDVAESDVPSEQSNAADTATEDAEVPQTSGGASSDAVAVSDSGAQQVPASVRGDVPK